MSDHRLNRRLAAPAFLGSLPSGESDPSVTLDCAGADSNSRMKPRKRDFSDMREFLRASATWAEANMNEWPWGGQKDEDDEYYFEVVP